MLRSLPGKNNCRNYAVDSILCCLELLHEFKSCTVKIPKKANMNAKQQSISKTKKTQEEFESFCLKLHIGLAIGPTYHVILGSVADNIIKERLEYFIAGPSVKESCELLAMSPSGYLCVSERLWNLFSSLLSKESGVFELQDSINPPNQYSFSKNHAKISPLEDSSKLNIGICKKGYRIVSQEETGISILTNLLKKYATTYDEVLIDNIPKTLKFLSFVEESLSASLKIALSESSNYADILKNEILTNFNQVRRKVIVVFISLKSLNVAEFNSPENISKAQKAFSSIISITQLNGGCCRQFGCDDKLTSALLVWGMDGYIHEKGDTVYAVRAALEIQDKLNELEFSIGIATGSVFSGIIGSDVRCDGTIFGTCVNTAARFMCHSLSHGRIICDKETYNSCSNFFKFLNNGIPEEISIKGNLENMGFHKLIIRCRNVQYC